MNNVVKTMTRSPKKLPITFTTCLNKSFLVKSISVGKHLILVTSLSLFGAVFVKEKVVCRAVSSLVEPEDGKVMQSIFKNDGNIVENKNNDHCQLVAQ